MLRHLRFAVFFSHTLVGNLRAARADIPPLDICFDEGASCSNVTTGGKGGGTGTCQKAKCQRAAPPGEAGAGGAGVIVYDCLRCLGGAGGSGGSPATGGSGGSAGIVEPPPGGSAGESSGGAAVVQGGSAGSEIAAGEGGVTGVTAGGCDCSVGRFRQEQALALVMFAGGLYLLRRSRRRG
jgi:hypothetical protein